MLNASITDLRQAYRWNREKAWIAFLFAGMMIPAYLISSMISRAFKFSPLKRFIGQVFGPSGIQSQTFAAIIFGFYLGLLVLLFIDHQKRAQSVFLFFATVVGLVVLLLRGRFIPFLGTPDLIFMIISMVFAVLIAGREQLRYIEISNAVSPFKGRLITGKGQSPLEFPRAQRMLFRLLVGFILISFWEAHTQYYSPLVRQGGELVFNPGSITGFQLANMQAGTLAGEIAGCMGFVLIFYSFLGYSADKSIFVVGPAGSGKTHFVLGLNLEAGNRELQPRNHSHGLPTLRRQMVERADFVDRTRAGDSKDLSFEFTAGKIFVKNIELNALDYPGEYLPLLAPGLRYTRGELAEEDWEDLIKRSTFSKGNMSAAVDGGGQARGQEEEGTIIDPKSSEDEDDRGEFIGEKLAPTLDDSDTLLFLIDMERYLSGDRNVGANHFETILTHMPDTTEVILVATKCDLILDEFYDQYPARPNIRKREHYPKFRRFVTEKFQNSADIGPLLDAIQEDPYPVYFETYQEGEARQLELGPNQDTPNMVGFKFVIDRIAR